MAILNLGKVVGETPELPEIPDISTFMTIDGGQLGSYTEKIVTDDTWTGEVDLSKGNVFVLKTSKALTLSFKGVKNGAHSVTMIVELAHTVTYPASITWTEDDIPEGLEKSVITLLTIDGGDTWIGMNGGEVNASR